MIKGQKIMRKNYIIFSWVVALYLLTNVLNGTGFALPVLPNAPWKQGFGIDTTAGSGRHLAKTNTNIVKVTNLNDSGPGSFRDAIENQLSPKVIIFEVSGTIELKKPLTIGGYLGNDAEITGSYITIAGQTAPSPGITIKGHRVKVERNTHDILIQHIRFRRGEENLTPGEHETWDVLIFDNHLTSTKQPPYNIVLDHCSISWGVDENIEWGADSSTMINSIVSEGLHQNKHPKGDHSKGLLAVAYEAGKAGAQNVVFAQNLFIHNFNRNPSISTGSVVIANNLLYDFLGGIKVDDHSAKKGTVKVSIAGNYLIETDITDRSIYMIFGHQSGSQAYIAPDNFFRGNVQKDPWSKVNQCGNFSEGCTKSVPKSNMAGAPPVWPNNYITMTAKEAKAYVLSNVGARPADRDAVDARLIDDAKDAISTNALIDCIECSNKICVGKDNPYDCCTGSGQGECDAAPGGWPNLAKNIRKLSLPSNPHQIMASGYTKLEEWLHEFSNALEGGNYISPPKNLRIQ